ncbi:MAG: 16S rRNA (guanine(527)-N(7))-methyltransferase RsmG [Candidatus Acidiferrales bacterium]
MSLPTDAEIEIALKPYGLAPSPDLSAQIRTYVALLLKWNRSVSLTTVTGLDQILRFHFGESLFALTAFPIENGRLADVGSGAGFPGIPLAMVAPSLRVTLIESNAKKFAFLNEVIRELRIKNVQALHCRMEDVKQLSQRFDFITARAVGQFDELLKWSRKHLNPSGIVLLWLGYEDSQRISNERSWIWHPQVPIPGSERRFLLAGSPKS